MAEKHAVRSPICRIEMSALAAVIWVLAIVMMLSLPPESVRGVGVDIPKVRQPQLAHRALREDAISIAIMRDGKIYYSGDRWIVNARLADSIRSAWMAGAEQRIYIRADARVPYRSVKEVLDAVREAGVENVSFLVEQRKPMGQTKGPSTS